jgi:hypothetical protein
MQYTGLAIGTTAAVRVSAGPPSVVSLARHYGIVVEKTKDRVVAEAKETLAFKLIAYTALYT